MFPSTENNYTFELGARLIDEASWCLDNMPIYVLQSRVGRCAAHCKKDTLEWRCVPRWPFAIISIVTQKKALNSVGTCISSDYFESLLQRKRLEAIGWNSGYVGKSFFIIWESCAHFKALKCVERSIINVWGCKNVHIRIRHMQHHSTIFIVLFSSSHMRFSNAYFLTSMRNSIPRCFLFNKRCMVYSLQPWQRKRRKVLYVALVSISCNVMS